MCKRCKEKRLKQLQKVRCTGKKQICLENLEGLSTEKYKNGFVFCCMHYFIFTFINTFVSILILEILDVWGNSSNNLINLIDLDWKRKYIFCKYIFKRNMYEQYVKKHVLETCLLSIVSRNQELKLMHLLCSFVKENDLIYLDHHPL